MAPPSPLPFARIPCKRKPIARLDSRRPPHGEGAAAKAAARDFFPPQIAALEALLAGSNVTDAAAAAGVDRSTLHNWRRKNFAFQAALNAGRYDLRQAIAHRLERLANNATECVDKAVRGGDVKAALEIVKRLNVVAAISAAKTRTSWRSTTPSGNSGWRNAATARKAGGTALRSPNPPTATSTIAKGGRSGRKV